MPQDSTDFLLESYTKLNREVGTLVEQVRLTNLNVSKNAQEIEQNKKEIANFRKKMSIRDAISSIFVFISGAIATVISQWETISKIVKVITGE